MPAPLPVAASVNTLGRDIEIDFDIDVFPTEDPAFGFSLKVNGIARGILGGNQAVGVDSDTLALTIDEIGGEPLIYIGDVVTVSYDAGSGNVFDNATQTFPLATFADFPAVNNSTVPRPVPDVPSGVAAHGGILRVTVDWDADPVAATVRVYRSDDGGVTYAHRADVAAPAAHLVDAGLAAGKTYFYRVLAANAAGESNLSDPVFATTHRGPMRKPTPPTPKRPAVSARPKAGGLVEVVLDSGPLGDEVYFTLDGSTPVPGVSPRYAGPITCNAHAVITAVTTRPGGGGTSTVVRAFVADLL